MPDSPLTQPNTKLRLECSADENTLVVKMPSEQERALPTYATDSTGAVTGLVGPDGGKAPFPYILSQSAVPRILPSSGSSNATGQIDLTTPLPYQPSGTVQLYLPAGVVTAGSAGTGAGLYPVVFSLNNRCQIQGTGIVTANAAYTQTTAADIQLATITVPGGAMGANGALRTRFRNSHPNNANNKIQKLLLGASAAYTATTTAQSGLGVQVTGANRGVQSAQSWPNNASDASFSNGNTNTSIDTSTNQSLTFTGQLAVATDFIILEGYTVEVLPGA